MENWYVPILIGAVVGVIAGWFVAKRSAKQDPIYGGSTARLFHYLGAAVFASMPLSSIFTILMGGGFVRAVLTGIVISVISYVLLLIFSAIEQPARQSRAAEDEGWTAQKAKESGL